MTNRARTAAQDLKHTGIRLTHDNATSEYRVAFRAPNGRDADDAEASAYYTNDLDDAIATGRRMVYERALVRDIAAQTLAVAHLEAQTARVVASLETHETLACSNLSLWKA